MTTSSRPDTGRPVTEEQARQLLAWYFGHVREAERRTEQREQWEVHPRSALGEDDRRTSPYQTSHVVQGLIGSAIDHMHAIANLVETAGVLHPMAPFTLVRSALETAAQAIWLLEPRHRDERVARRIRLALTDATDSYRTSAEMDLPRKLSLDQTRAQLFGIAGRAGLAEAAVHRPVTSTACLRVADDVVDTPLKPMVAWQIGSGLAHGRSWATISFLVREEIADSGPEAGVGTYRVTSSVGHLAWALGVALDCTNHAFDLYRTRAKPAWS